MINFGFRQSENSFFTIVITISGFPVLQVTVMTHVMALHVTVDKAVLKKWNMQKKSCCEELAQEILCDLVNSYQACCDSFILFLLYMVTNVLCQDNTLCFSRIQDWTDVKWSILNILWSQMLACNCVIINLGRLSKEHCDQNLLLHGNVCF